MSQPDLSTFDPQVRTIVERRLGMPLAEKRLTALAGDNPADWLGSHVFPGTIEYDENERHWSVSLDVLSAVLTSEDARDTTLALQTELRPYGYQALMTSVDSAPCPVKTEAPDIEDPEFLKSSLALLKTTQLVFFKADDAIPLLVVRQTNGINCEVTLEDVVARLDHWHTQCEFAVVSAGFDFLDIQFSTLPQDLNAFAEEVYAFCPDTLDQGILKTPPEDFGEFSMEDQLDWMDDALESQTPADLAAMLAEHGQLFLWWD